MQSTQLNSEVSTDKDAKIELRGEVYSGKLLKFSLSGDSEGWRKWWLFESNSGIPFFDNYDDILGGSSFILDRHYRWSGPGRSFQKDAYIRKISNRRILIVQYGGMDI